MTAQVQPQKVPPCYPDCCEDCYGNCDEVYAAFRKEAVKEVLDEIQNLPTHINEQDSFSIPFIYKYELDKKITELRQEKKE